MTDRQEYFKKYYEKNKQEKKEYGIDYYENNKEQIIKKQSVPITCECGTLTQKWNLSNHRKSKKHFKLLNKI